MTMLTDQFAAFIYTVATALLLPVLAIESACVVIVVFEAGRFSIEAVRRWRSRSATRVESLTPLVGDAASGGLRAAVAKLGSGPVVVSVARALGDGSAPTHTALVKILADAEIETARRLDRTRVLLKMGPVLGLMGTLIPISPALVGLAKGDVETLSSNLVVAFSTTVVGLFIGAVAFIVTTVRERNYEQDLADIEFLFEHVEA